MRSYFKRNLFIVSVLLIFSFKNSPAAPVKESFVSPSPQSNVEKYLSVFGDKNWNKIDFRKFSRKYNRKTYKYDFTLDNFFRNIKSGK